MRVHYVHVDWSTHEAQIRQIRERVFAFEPSAASDDLDPDAGHFLALNEAGQALGAVRILKSGRVGLLAVLPGQQRRGIGRQLLNAASEYAKNLQLARVFVQTPRAAEAFFYEAGFRAASTAPSTPNTPDVEMELTLPIPFQPPERTVGTPIPPRDATIDESRPYRLVQFDSEHECRAAVASLLAGARRTVALLSSALDPQLFASDACLASVSAFARRSRHTRVRILVEDAKAIAAGGHPLLELARRLPSKVLIRRLPDDHEVPMNSYMVVDEEGVWMLPDRFVYAGWWNEHDRVEARRLSDEFMWTFERGVEDPELRLLSL